MPRPGSSETPRFIPLWIHVSVVAAVFLAAYATDAGTGFIKDDAGWIARSRIAGLPDLVRLFTETGGFFRPVVGLSFGVNYWLFDGSPVGYGWTNLVLAAAGAAAVYRLGVALGFARGAAVFAASVWILNFHGINMAVLWLSGRTALLLVLFSVLAAADAARGRFVASSAWAVLALLSKEEAVLLPVILVAVAALRPGASPSRATLLRFAAALAVILGVYALLRSTSDAMTPFTAPWYYRFTLAPDVLWKNVTEYADRAGSLVFGAVMAVVAIAGWRLRLEREEWRLVLMGAIWFVAAFGLTGFLPVRSSLYACLPSVGAAIAGGAVATAAWRATSARSHQILAVAGLVIPVMFLPIYRTRNVRWTELGKLSTVIMHEVASAARTAPDRWNLIVVDDRTTRANVAAALGWALPAAAELTTGKRPTVWIVPPPPDSTPAEHVLTPTSADAVIIMRGQQPVRMSRSRWRPSQSAVYQ